MYGAVVPALVVIIARIHLALVAFTISIVSFFVAPIRVAFVRRAQTGFVDPLHAADAVWYFGATSVLFAVRPAGAAPPVAFFARMYGAVVPALVVIIARIHLAPVAFTISIVSFFAAPMRVAFVRRAQMVFVDPLHAADAVWYFGAASVLFAVRPAGAAPPVAFFARMYGAVVPALVVIIARIHLAPVVFAEFHGFARESAVLVRASMFLAAPVPSPHVAARDFVL